MNPRINVGKGVTGCVRYVLGEGRDPKTGELLPDPLDGSSRVAWIGGTGFGFNIKTEAHAELARRIMEFDAQNQKGQAQQDCMHLSLSWRIGEKPTREQMEEAARDALKALGMGNAKALFVAHRDENYDHVHIIASNINPATATTSNAASASYRHGRSTMSASMAALSRRGGKPPTNCAMRSRSATPAAYWRL